MKSIFNRLLLGCGVIAASAVGLYAISSALMTRSSSAHILLFQDISSSTRQAESFHKHGKRLCAAVSNKAREDDFLTGIVFADEAQEINEFLVGNRMEALGACKKLAVEQLQVGKEEGTSLEVPMDYAASKIRQFNTTSAEGSPSLVIISIQKNDTGTGREADIANISRLMQTLSAQKAAVVIFTDDNHLQQQLDRNVQHPNLRVCPTKALNTCLEFGFKRLRSL